MLRPFIHGALAISADPMRHAEGSVLPDFGGPFIDLFVLGVHPRYALCGELVCELATRCADEAPVACSSQPTLEHVSRILVMRPHRYSARLFTKPANLDNDLSVDSADISDSADYFVSSGKLHITLHQTECAKF
ncbi:hypothetical protein [Bradyrhizobium yuanmingense]|uniref:hypothetical protein n=1 Tax=Bradyrhizobium yuanmingense TaxID=108015 RepID=UPI00351722BD